MEKKFANTSQPIKKCITSATCHIAYAGKNDDELELSIAAYREALLLRTREGPNTGYLLFIVVFLSLFT
jgi:hypothetical protein